MRKRDFAFRMKALDNQTGAFEGKLAVYSTVDLGGDMILPGAFTRSIQNQGSQVPLLWQHRTDEPIGTLTLNDGPDALRVNGQLLLDLPMAQKAYLLLQSKIIKGMSIGYDVIKESMDNNVRLLKELRLWEGSLVTFPMNEAAHVTSIKSLDEVAGILRGFRPDDAKGEALTHFKNIKTELRRLLRKDADCGCQCAACLAGDCDDCGNALCFDQNCEGHTEDERDQAQELAELMQLAARLKDIVG